MILGPSFLLISLLILSAALVKFVTERLSHLCSSKAEFYQDRIKEIGPLYNRDKARFLTIKAVKYERLSFDLIVLGAIFGMGALGCSVYLMISGIISALAQ